MEGIVRFGLLPGGGSVTNRVAVHWIEHAQGGAQPGLRSGSTALVTTKVKYLREAGITLYRGSENVILTTAVPSEHLREVFAWNYDEAERGDDLALHDGRALKLIEVEAEVDETGDADVEEGALPTGDTDDEDDSLDQVVSPAVTRDAAATARSSGSASAAPPVKSEAALARAAGVMVSREEVVAGEKAATESGSPAVKADAVAGSSGPAVPRDAARRAKRVGARRGGPQNRKKSVQKRIMKRDKEVKRLVTYVGHLKLLRESLSRRDPKRPTFQEYTKARSDLRRKLPPGTVGDKQFDGFVGAACTTCDDRDTKGKGVVRAFAALRAVRGRRKPGGPLPVVLKPAAPAVQSERGEEERPDDRPKCPNGHELEFNEVLGSEDYCDRCDGIFSRFARMQKCFLCQYSLCELCYVTERGEIREELKRKFRYIEKEDKRLEEEERRPPPVVLKGRVGEPAVRRERGGTSTTSARRVAKAEAESKVDWPEAPPPPPPPGKPRSRRTREVEKEKEKDEDDEESPPPPPPGKPPRSVKSSRNKMGNEAEGRATEPAEASEPAASSPTITFPWGSWICPKCNGVNVPHSKVCGHQFEGGPCVGSFWEATKWAPYVEPAVPGGTREERREERRRVKVQALDLALRHGTWMCRRCGGDNLKSRNKCYKCSTFRTRQRRADESESSGGDSERERKIAESVASLMASFARPKGRKRGGARHKKSTPKKKAKKKKVCRCGKSHKAVRPRHVVPAGRLCLKGFKSWLVAKKARNRLVHALNGNVAWQVARLSFLLGLVPLVPLVYHTEQELEQTVTVVLESAAVATGEILDEVGSSARLVVRVIFQLSFFLILTVLWAVTRAWRNRLMHALVGNIPCKLLELTKDGESTCEVKGSRSAYKVWISEEGGRSGCSCRVFLDEGTCGHIDAAVSAAREQKILEPKVRFTSTAAERGLAALGSPSTQIRPTSTGASCLPFDAIAKKARGLVAAKKEEKKREESGCFSGIASKGSKKEPVLPAETLAIEDGPVVSENLSQAQVAYLVNSAALEEAVEIMNKAKVGWQICVRAYSFDQPDLVSALKEAASRGAACKLISDQSQANGKTKNQVQSLKEVQSAGVQVRLACGSSVNAAYQSDGRAVRAGRVLMGLHHAKSLLATSPTETIVLAGSCNFTTSSKANQEAGVKLILKKGSPFQKSWEDEFCKSFEGAETLEEFEHRISNQVFRRSPTVERE